MSLSRNLLAGLASSVWTAVIGLAVVPLYLKYLGIEAYGLIGFFATMQAMLVLLDMGLAPTINREVARHSATGNLPESGRLLHTLAVVYWSMAAGIALLMFALAPLISEHWLQSKHLSVQTIQHAVMLMGFVAACRWPVGLYQGALMGAERMTVASAVSTVMATFGSLGAVAMLAFVSPTIETFFMWQAGVGLLNALSMRFAAWRIIGRLKNLSFDVDALKQIWRFSAGMSGVAILGTILMQLDKVLLSRMISLEDFGRYALAGMVAGGVGIFISPVFNAIYPRFSALASTTNSDELMQLYRLGTRILSMVLFPVAFSVAFFAKDLLFVWTGNLELATSTAPIVMLLVIGTSIHGVMHFPYALQLAYGMAGLTFMITLILLVILVPLIIFLVLYHGALGGAAAWLILNVIYLPLGAWLTHRHLLKGLGMKWLLIDVCLPFVLSALIVGVGESVLAGQIWEHYARLLFAGGLGISAMLLSLTVSPQLRNWALLNYRKEI